MRPILFDISTSTRPATMTVCFPGRPNRFIVVRMKSDVRTLEDAKSAAVKEMGAWTLDELMLLGESAAPAPVATDPIYVSATIEKVEQEERYAGAIHCPTCCRPLGRGDSPAIGYIEQCPGCHKRLMIRFTPGAFTVIVWPDAWPPDDRPNLSSTPPTITDE